MTAEYAVAQKARHALETIRELESMIADLLLESGWTDSYLALLLRAEMDLVKMRQLLRELTE